MTIRPAIEMIRSEQSCCTGSVDFSQMVGLLVAPAGVVGNLVQRDVVTEGVMLMILCIGGGVFLVGWLLQQVGRKQ